MQALISQEEWEEYQTLKNQFDHKLATESSKSVEVFLNALKRLENEGRNTMRVSDIIATVQDDLAQMNNFESKRKQYAKAAR